MEVGVLGRGAWRGREWERQREGLIGVMSTCISLDQPRRFLLSATFNTPGCPTARSGRIIAFLWIRS